MKSLDCVLVALGSGAGGLARYVLGGMIATRWPAALPMGTLIINVTGCFVLGVLGAALALRADAWSGWRPLIGVGLCGGYTTFSTLMYDSYKLKPGLGSLNIVLSLLLGLLAVWLGTRLGGYLGAR